MRCVTLGSTENGTSGEANVRVGRGRERRGNAAEARADDNHIVIAICHPSIL
jgi:hypothetical protein